MGIYRVRVVLCGMVMLAMVSTSTYAKGWLRDVDHALSVAQTQQQPLVLFVSMDGCAYCYKMIETTFRDARIQKTLGTSFVAAAIKGSERPDLIKHLQIRSFPTTLLISPEGQVVDKMVGYVSADKFQKRLVAVTNQQRRLTSNRQPAAPVSSRHVKRAAPSSR